MTSPAVIGGGRRRWWQAMVLYENHLPSFRDGNGDGIGDLEGLIQSLDYLASTLGVTAIWVGPFYRSPLLDQGSTSPTTATSSRSSVTWTR